MLVHTWPLFIYVFYVNDSSIKLFKKLEPECAETQPIQRKVPDTLAFARWLLVAFLSALLMAATFLPGSAPGWNGPCAPFLLKEPCHPLDTSPFGCSTTLSSLMCSGKSYSFIDYLVFLLLGKRWSVTTSTSWTKQNSRICTLQRCFTPSLRWAETRKQQ